MYDVPGPKQLREWLKAHDLTGAAAARLVGVEARAVRRWTSPEATTSYRAIQWSAWVLLRLWVKEITMKQIEAEIPPKE